MKTNPVTLLLTFLIGAVLGIIFGPVLFRPGIPDGIARDFGSCHEACDKEEREVERAFTICSAALEAEWDSIEVKCLDPSRWTEACIKRIRDYAEKNRQCNQDFRTGVLRVRECRIRCNDMISIKEE